MNWNDIRDLIASTNAKNVYVAGDTLRGNDSLILTYDPKIAAGYVRSDWDAINCKAAR
jgi:hypothetical protein